MIKRLLRCFVATVCFISAGVQADSPITSISFAEGYDLKDLYSQDHQLLVRELALGDSPIGEKLAVIAGYPAKDELVSKLKVYLRTLADAQEKPDLLLTLAYAMMVNNPNDTETPRLLLSLAYPDYSDKQSLLMLESLVLGQKWFNSDDWGNIYRLVSQYQSLEDSLIKDVNSSVANEFIRYLGLYEEYCQDCEPAIGPSFSCSNTSKLSQVEKQICGSSQLSRADRVLANLYNFVQVEIENDDLRASQLNWLDKRAKCDDEQCIYSEYSERISELVGMVTVEKLVSHTHSTHKNAPQTMREIQQAEKLKMEIAFEEMNAYLAEALIAEVEQKDAIQNSQSLWEQYANAHCDAVYERWSGGSVRFFEYYRCHKELILERTRVIWKEFLTYPDNTPPILPDPTKWGA
ncbi:lysozyme inhibitor LprI family protein [Marinobacter nauticus]|uniref:Lysozyme inhibitor LprI-like N-terminal domain-containing protein n=1 Tax=Marinobacter nauticus (strain ATCC 700491 / DSM 11845 / VT8) TaxID=351348 RepID=A1U091_MARN8|nr:lysozyme inhibitor LprI family protein [Marinobacter nauticus]ABM18410.1 hypothetical protein Maqu_1321 [Marinobacter nauticus VT8]